MSIARATSTTCIPLNSRQKEDECLERVKSGWELARSSFSARLMGPYIIGPGCLGEGGGTRAFKV